MHQEQADDGEMQVSPPLLHALQQVSAQQTAVLARQAAAEQRRSDIEGQVQAQEQTVQQLELAAQEVADRMAVERQRADARHTTHAEAQVILLLVLEGRAFLGCLSDHQHLSSSLLSCVGKSQHLRCGEESLRV